MNKNFSQKCAIACQFLPFIQREDFLQEFIEKTRVEELTKECQEFLELCCNNEKNFYEQINKNKIPKELLKFKK